MIELPTYDYKCKKCGYTFSVEQSIVDKPLTRCRKCRGRLEKLLPQSISLIFKGSGFYATDYKKTAGRTKGAGGQGARGAKGKRGEGKGGGKSREGEDKA
jgi:putative FmdB family regulatory protein